MERTKPYKQHLTDAAFGPMDFRRRIFFNDPPNPAPTAEELQAQLASEKAEREKTARENADLKQRLDAAAAKEREEAEKTRKAEELRLQQGNEYKTLYENSELSKKDLQTQLDNQNKAIVNREVRNLIRQEARKVGLKPEFEDVLDTIPMTGVVSRAEIVNGEMQISATGIAEHVQAVKASKGSMFGAPPALPVNNNPPGPTPPATRPVVNLPTIKNSELQKLKKENRPEYEKKYGEALAGRILVTAD